MMINNLCNHNDYDYNGDDDDDDRSGDIHEYS